MYIRNISSMGRTYSCTRFIGEWIKEKNFPVLSIENNRYYFADTELLREVIERIPIWMKVVDIF